jgi:hypothetical protein
MADVDTPTCRAISAMVIPQSSINLRETSALTAGISPAAPAAQFGEGNFTFFAFFCNQALNLTAGAAIAGLGLAIIHSSLILLNSATISVWRVSSLMSFSISLGMTDILSGTPDPDSQAFQGYKLDHRRTRRRRRRTRVQLFTSS